MQCGHNLKSYFSPLCGCRHPRPCGPGSDPLRGSPFSGPRATLGFATAPGHRLAKCPARCRERPIILQVSTVRHHRRCIRPSLCCGRGSTMADGGAFVCHRPSIHRRLTVVAFSFHRFGYACALAAPFGGWHRFSPSSPAGARSAALRFTSSVCAFVHPCPGNEETTKELIGTLPPYPLPPL